MKIRSLGRERTDTETGGGRTDGRTNRHDEANRRIRTFTKPQKVL